MKLKFKKLDKAAICPVKGSSGAAAFDLVSIETGVVYKGQCSKFRTGLSLEIPKGYFGVIAPRSGLGFNETISILGGILDEDYRGEIIVGLTKGNDENITPIIKGQRIAQLLIIKNTEIEFEEVEKLEETKRADTGFGASGTTVADLLK